MTVFTVRNYGHDDLSTLVKLINDADQVDDAGFATTAEALAHRFAMPDFGPQDAIFLAEHDGHLVGYAAFFVRHHDTCDRIGTMGIVHPDFRRQGIGTALMKRLEERARALKGDKPLFLDIHARERVPGVAELALSLGMQPIRWFFWMECHALDHLPEPIFPDGIRLRTYVVGQDEASFVAAYNEAFSDHWGFHLHTLEQELHRQNFPGFRADDTFLAINADGQIAGLCIVLFPLVEGQPRGDLGIVDDLAVRPAYRRRGLGRALLLTGMRRIREHGCSKANLGVDADNPNQARRLYEAVGFGVASCTTAYHKELV